MVQIIKAYFGKFVFIWLENLILHCITIILFSVFYKSPLAFSKLQIIPPPKKKITYVDTHLPLFELDKKNIFQQLKQYKIIIMLNNYIKHQLKTELKKHYYLIFFSFLAFFVATQFFYTISFVGMLVSAGMILMYLLCIDDYYRVKVLRWIGFDLIVSGNIYIQGEPTYIIIKFQ